MIIFQIAVFFISAIFIFKVAEYKGFNPWAWLFSGLIGFIIMLLVPSSNADAISEEKSEKRRKIGNAIGIVVTVFVILLSITINQWLPKVFDLFM
jgi:inner membrane protein involved in colicin E2 resistance